MFQKILLITLLFALLAGCAVPVPLEPAAPTPEPLEPAGPTPQPVQPGPLQETPLANPLPGTGSSPEPVRVSGLVAFAGQDENIWLLDPESGELRQITNDALPFQMGVEGPTRRYSNPRWSSNGRFLAYQQEHGQPAQDGMSYSFSLMVYDLFSNSSTPLLEDRQVAGFAWRPGTNQIAFAVPPVHEYFARSGPKPELARGIYAIDVSNPVPYELAPAENGFTLVNPHWAADGRFLSFEEIEYMEGRGRLAYYDFETQEYISWDRPVGSYTWSPDGETIAYDTLTYIATGEERIWLNNRLGTAEQPFTPNPNDAYTYGPVFSPQGDRLAFVIAYGIIEATRYTLYVQPLEGGEPTDLGQYQQPYELSWTPDGNRLVFSSGPYDGREIIEVNLEDGSSRVLAQGSSPALQP